MSGESAIIAGKADCHKEKRDKQTMSYGTKASFNVRVVLRASKHVSQKVGSRNAGDAAQPLRRNCIDHDQREHAARDGFVGRKFAELQNQWIQKLVCGAIPTPKK